MNKELDLLQGLKPSKLFKNPKFSAREIADDHDFGTAHARNLIFASKCVFLDILSHCTNNSIST